MRRQPCGPVATYRRLRATHLLDGIGEGLEPVLGRDRRHTVLDLADGIAVGTWRRTQHSTCNRDRKAQKCLNQPKTRFTRGRGPARRGSPATPHTAPVRIRESVRQPVSFGSELASSDPGTTLRALGRWLFWLARSSKNKEQGPASQAARGSARQQGRAALIAPKTTSASEVRNWCNCLMSENMARR
jgi:hypothetical protein